MPEDLRRQLGRSQVEAQRQDNQAEADASTPQMGGSAEAHRKGFRPPERRYPVLIKPDGPVSSREQLQELVGGPDLPEISTTMMYEPAGPHRPGEPMEGTIPEEVQICDVDSEQLAKLEEVAKVNSFAEVVKFQGDERYAAKVLSLKETEDEAPWRRKWAAYVEACTDSRKAYDRYPVLIKP
ncbi:hypothetical protein TOPH_01114 [Tolypocladium ophioglossoides CBS 100239]|uniref:Uncharacterized protein n=1 Tax=Tolypocladium ophioglossoides (strain CBS 100239) TaxID=1163406 RepID=A0A0L0NJC2_TOLOC|nr:hypothetical protein TOPH_01114 [Tolypocladium ophioglossoides CBS 100239]